MICPFMSCRVTKADDGGKTITPTVVQCVKECAIYDHDSKGCSVHRIMEELIKRGE